MEQFRYFFICPGSCKGVNFSAEFFASKTCFVNRARAHAPQRAVASKTRQQRKCGKSRERFQREQNFCACAPLHRVKHGRVGRKTRRVQHKAGRRDKAFVKQQPWAEHTAYAASTHCQGRPYAARSCMKGSGSNCSMFHTPGLRHVPSAMSFVPIMAGTPVV